MGFYNILPELLLLVADNLSLGDLINFRSTCSWVKKVLTSPFQKLCLQDVGTLTALQWAAVRGHAKLIELAISNGAAIDLPFSGDLRLPTLGVRGNVFQKYFMHPCELAHKDLYSKNNKSTFLTPLFHAACYSHVKAIKVLLDHGARTKYFDGIMTPAHAAATQGNVLCMQPFVRPGFDINFRGAYQTTILHHATLGGKAMLKYILELDGGTSLVNAKTRSGLTPLHCLRTRAGNLDCQRSQVELLLQYGADIYARDNDGNTPAHSFAYWGDTECLQALIDAGFDLHTRGKCGKTILHCAMIRRKETLTYLLGLEKGRDIIDIEDDHQLTVLDYASTHPFHLRVAEILLRHNARRKSSDAMPLVLNTECCDSSYPAGGFILGEAW